MAYVANTMFEVTNSNITRNETQNVAGYFGTSTGTTFVSQDCSAGTICVPNGLTPMEGYEQFNFLNGNTYYFNVATAGTSGSNPTGDHTGLYFSNTYGVNAVSDGTNTWNLGAKTLGLGVPAGERGDFTEIIIGEKYTVGSGNFSTAPSSGVTSGYATIANGFLVFSASAPAAGSGVYFVVERAKNQNEGTDFWGLGYVLQARRAALS